ncbi:hypothetical protein PG996_001194 [Apiospora saccharicola]|uniref:Major facilitator superfamily (MFS) profile domain-containing protein n=1 Tax=Apiospora saccharicola TaxID=335842 RepID=A0ABR1WK52_9PEZI
MKGPTGPDATSARNHDVELGLRDSLDLENCQHPRDSTNEAAQTLLGPPEPLPDNSDGNGDIDGDDAHAHHHRWTPPRNFIWIQIAIMSNVFLYGFACHSFDYNHIPTIINSDMIPFQMKGMYQALQNGVTGFGYICGASLGGAITDTIGWRWCFILQVPISVFAFFVGWLAVEDPKVNLVTGSKTLKKTWHVVDFSGALLLVMAVSVRLVGLSLGGNELPWSSPWVIGALLGSLALFALFIRVEKRTKAIPMIPLRMLNSRLPILIQVSNVCAGASAFALSTDERTRQFLFVLPLFFQVVLLNSATQTGVRLVIPSLAVPIGGLIAGIVTSRWGKLLTLIRVGAILMVVGNGLATPSLPRSSTSSGPSGLFGAYRLPPPSSRRRSASGFPKLLATYPTDGQYGPFILSVFPSDQLNRHVSRIQPSVLVYIVQGSDIESMSYPFSISTDFSEARWVVGELCLDKNGLTEVASIGGKVFFHDIFLGRKIAKNELCRGRGEGSRNLGHEELEEPL